MSPIETSPIERDDAKLVSEEQSSPGSQTKFPPISGRDNQINTSPDFFHTTAQNFHTSTFRRLVRACNSIVVIEPQVLAKNAPTVVVRACRRPVHAVKKIGNYGDMFHRINDPFPPTVRAGAVSWEGGRKAVAGAGARRG